MITVVNNKEDIQLDSNGFTIANTENDGNGFSFSVADTGGNTPSATFDPIITVGDASTQSVHFVNGSAALPVYTKSEVDSILSGLDGITYKGTLGNTGATVSSLPTASSSGGVSNGDMYIMEILMLVIQIVVKAIYLLHKVLKAQMVKYQEL